MFGFNSRLTAVAADVDVVIYLFNLILNKIYNYNF